MIISILSKIRPHRKKNSNESYSILKIWEEEGMQRPLSCGWLFPGTRAWDSPEFNFLAFRVRTITQKTGQCGT